MNDFEEEDADFLTDELDHEILMHRDAHFGGSFEVMLDYYEKNGLGVLPEIDIDRIVYLEKVEAEMGTNLAATLLTAAEAEKVGRARAVYRELKKVYEKEDEKNSTARLIADLFLTEEEEPEAEIAAVVAKKEKIVPELIHIIRSEETYDPLFPGYGYAPALAIEALGKIGDERAIIPLFELLGKEVVFSEEVILEALLNIGSKAKEFLIKRLQSRPLSGDTINAAWGLTIFPTDEKLSQLALHQLQDPSVLNIPILSAYLLCLCEGLKEPQDRETLKKLSQDPSASKDLQKEMALILKRWKL